MPPPELAVGAGGRSPVTNGCCEHVQRRVPGPAGGYDESVRSGREKHPARGPQPTLNPACSPCREAAHGFGAVGEWPRASQPSRSPPGPRSPTQHLSFACRLDCTPATILAGSDASAEFGRCSARILPTWKTWHTSAQHARPTYSRCRVTWTARRSQSRCR